MRLDIAILAFLPVAALSACSIPANDVTTTYLPLHEREWKSWSENAIYVAAEGNCQDGAPMMRLHNAGDRSVNTLVCKSTRLGGPNGSNKTREFLRMSLGPRSSRDVGCTKQGSTVVEYSLAWSDMDDGHVPQNIQNANEALITFRSNNYVVMNRHAKKTVTYGWHDPKGRTNYVTLPPGDVTSSGPQKANIFQANYSAPYTPASECTGPLE